MDKDMFERLFRTALQVVGAIVATRYIGEENWAAVSGALLTIATTGWTVYAARRVAK